MKIRLIKKKTVKAYVEKNAQSKSSFEAWLSTIKRINDWKYPNDIKKTFGQADLLGNASNRVIFDIGGNKYRMICKYWFGAGMVYLYVKWIGTHVEYNKLCKKNEQYTINIFKI